MSAMDIIVVINNTILSMDKPFKLSQLYSVLSAKGIEDKAMILDVLNQLYETGLVDRTDVEEDVPQYKSNFQ
ncbi:MAG: hypothetical protein E7289_04475 [Lachnospiraceae bacterium]|nr:hypothetical protein [Lachnospiraceae bacterium]